VSVKKNWSRTFYICEREREREKGDMSETMTGEMRLFSTNKVRFKVILFHG